MRYYMSRKKPKHKWRTSIPRETNFLLDGYRDIISSCKNAEINEIVIVSSLSVHVIFRFLLGAGVLLDRFLFAIRKQLFWSMDTTSREE